MIKAGISSVGAYIPYYYISRDTIARAWKDRGMKGVRSMHNDDEDSVTMAVEAARNCLRLVDKKEVNGLYFASTTAPYEEKSHACLISTVCDLPGDVFSMDVLSSTKGGTAALKAAADSATANPGSVNLVVTADCREAMPKTPKEQILGDAAAALAVSTENVIATIDAFTSVSNEIVDVWRNSGEKFVRWGESRFILDEGYHRAMGAAIKAVLAKAELKPGDITKLIVSAPDFREHLKLAKKTGFAPEQIQDPLLLEVGDCGTAQTLLILADALETAKPGDKLLVANYGSGADAMVLTVTEEVSRLQENHRTVRKLIADRREFTEYNRFLSYRKICPTTESVFNLRPSNAQTWREKDTFLRFKGSRCTKCGAEMFPANRICGKCGAVDEFERISFADRVCKVFTFTLDMLAGSSDDPVIGQICADDEKGVRYYNIATDFDPKEIQIGTELEFTFRKMNNLGNFVNYYWKFRPLRGGDKE